MTLEFLVLTNFCLFTRLIVLFRDDVASQRVWRWKTLGELGAIALLFPFDLRSLGLALTLVLVNLAGFRAERRSRRKDFARLLLGLVQLVLLSILLSPQFASGFRPALAGCKEAAASWTALAPLWDVVGGMPFHLVLAGLLISANEANLAIRAVFDWLDLKPRAAIGGGGVLDASEFNRGRVIGILERVLLFGFVLQAQYGAIGFILAAKAFTRFKALDDRPFAEYVLIGTLLSACLAFGTGGLVRWLLAH